MGECIITYNPSADKALGFNTLGELDFTDSEFKEFVRNNPLLFKEYIEKIVKDNINKKSEPVKTELFPLNIKEANTNNSIDFEKESRLRNKLKEFDTIEKLTDFYKSSSVSEESRNVYKYLFAERKNEIEGLVQKYEPVKLSRKGSDYIDNEPDGLPSIKMDTKDC